MLNNDTLLKLAKLGLEGDKVTLIEYLERLAAESSNKNKLTLSAELKKLLRNHTIAKESFTVSSMDGSHRPLNPIKSTLNMWLSDVLKMKVERFIAVHEDQTLSPELKKSYSRILLYGPPGSGKTTLGYYIAERLSIPIVYVKVSDVISSRFGETTRNIADIFAQPGRQLVFLDEFDAFGKSRFDSNDVGELKRIVNSLIQTLDFAASEKIVIGATNIIESIDPAIIRRFNISIKVDKLDKLEMSEFFNYLLSNNADLPVKFTAKDKKDIVSVFQVMGVMTVDAIKSVFEHTVINAHLSKSKQIGINDIYSTLLTSGHLDKRAMQKISDKDKGMYKMLMSSLSSNFNNVDISSYAGVHRNSLTNYKRKSL